MTGRPLPPAHALGADVLACVGFYTRLPVPGLAGERGFADAQWAAPVAGLVVGAIVGTVLLLAQGLGVPAAIAAVLALGAGIAITGALHEDGLADVADGFGGGRTREDKLAIMKDSRIGTYGVLALGLSLLVRWSALAALAGAGGTVAMISIVAAHATGRALMPAMMHRLPAARAGGVSAGVGAVGRNPALAATALGLLAVLPGGLAMTLACAAVLAIVYLGVEALAHRQIGGQTGDVLGALEQACETAILITAATLFLPETP